MGYLNDGVSKKEKRGSATSKRHKPHSMRTQCLADSVPSQPCPSDSRSGGIDAKFKTPANAQIRHNVSSNPTR